ncbi:MAG TPA: ATP-binding protein [Gemmata sp.]|nr:ATP-binding protein [Gemmata sp.]
MTTAQQAIILILEDDEGVARLQQRRLERVGYSVIVCATEEQALARIRGGGIDMLVLDNHLTGADSGLEFYARLKAEGVDLPVIMVTGYSDDATIVRALRTGVRDYIFKSVEYLDYLPDACRRVLEQVLMQREREQALRDLQARSEELRTTSQQLWQAARLAGVGELAASIAHELNNPLGTVSLRIEGVLSKTPLDDPRRAALEVIDQEVSRMSRLVKNLLQFSRAGRDQVSTVNVCEEITKTIELTEHHLRRRNIKVVPDYEPSLPDIYADRQQLRQVFLNLFTNAADAMPGGGQLVPRVRCGELPGFVPAVVIEVCDTGTGIATEHLPRVFDPFFTTKEEGKGTGLGLAICRRIIRQHHGLLELESQVNQGTTVRIVLPVGSEANVAGLRHDL